MTNNVKFLEGNQGRLAFLELETLGNRDESSRVVNALTGMRLAVVRLGQRFTGTGVIHRFGLNGADGAGVDEDQRPAVQAAVLCAIESLMFGGAECDRMPATVRVDRIVTGGSQRRHRAESLLTA